MTKSFELLHNFDGKIVYVLSDLAMKFKQFKPKAAWNLNKNESDFRVNSIYQIINSFNLELSTKLSKADVNIKDNFIFPVQQSSIYKTIDWVEKEFPNIDDRQIDLIYGGSFRAGRREEKMFEYFFDTPYSMNLYGNIKEKQFKGDYKTPPTFLGKLPFDELSNKNKSAISTIVIGDSNYNNNFFTLRILEGLRDDLVVFIDEDYDKKHILFPDWHYVKSKNDIDNKIRELKQNPDLYKEIIINQRKMFSKYSDQHFEDECKLLLKKLFTSM